MEKNTINTYAEQSRTLLDVREKVNKFGQCAIVRPTGFGKTYILTELIKDYKKVLYLYPAAVIRDTVVDRHYDMEMADMIDEDGNVIDPETTDLINQLTQMKENKLISNCDMMTYYKLIKLSDEELAEMDYDAILLDEVHRTGAPLTKIAVDKLFSALPDAHKIGATATPIRMDNIDVISLFFNDVMTYSFTLLDAINCGMLLRPYYCYCTEDFTKDLKDSFLAQGLNPDDYKDLITAKAIEMAKLFDMDKVIKETCDEHAKDTDYMKFIVFFANREHMHNKIKDVEEWFMKAYPNHSINTLKISSQNVNEAENVSKLPALRRKHNHIDLIACIDMLNMGYHVNDLTGIIMYRGTSSSTIFIQQLGRALSVGHNNSSIVIDIVDNLHRKAVFELKSKLTTKRLSKKTATVSKGVATHYHISPTDNKSIVSFDKKGNEIIKQNYQLHDNNTIIIKKSDGTSIPSTLVYDEEDDVIYDISSIISPDVKNVNNIDASCLIATGHMADVRDFIEKAVAEPIVHKGKYAIELHFRTWCMVNNIEYPISDEDLKRIYGLSKKDFMDEFRKIVKTNKLNYPLHDANLLLNIRLDNTDAPLIEACAESYNIAVNVILDMLDIPAA